MKCGHRTHLTADRTQRFPNFRLILADTSHKGSKKFVHFYRHGIPDSIDRMRPEQALALLVRILEEKFRMLSKNALVCAEIFGEMDTVEQELLSRCGTTSQTHLIV